MSDNQATETQQTETMAETSAAESYQQDVERFQQQQMEQHQQQTAQQQMHQLQELFLNNPDEFVKVIQGNIQEKITGQINQSLEGRLAIERARVKYPELAKYESYITPALQHVQAEAQQKSETLTPDQAIERAVTKFRSDFNLESPTANANSFNAYNLDPGGPQPKRPERTFSSMTPQEYDDYITELKRKRAWS